VCRCTHFKNGGKKAGKESGGREREARKKNDEKKYNAPGGGRSDFFLVPRLEDFFFTINPRKRRV